MASFRTELRRLASAFGSKTALARELGKSARQLGRYLSGEARPPAEVKSRVAALKAELRSQARENVRSVVVRTGSTKAAAKELGISQRQVQRILAGDRQASLKTAARARQAAKELTRDEAMRRLAQGGSVRRLERLEEFAGREFAGARVEAGLWILGRREGARSAYTLYRVTARNGKGKVKRFYVYEREPVMSVRDLAEFGYENEANWNDDPRYEIAEWEGDVWEKDYEFIGVAYI